ncbi:lycopene cyclase domain-containing protein [Myxococcus sp. K15C18031901]|uniref:lycopene cyclase domain-containing protein n=1 Tax=Myxococcus dinghuensis TaxID=2906761 RepID=UPI0020A7E5E4|nr:lycopene cyclase domain-containing protein [Myxococcus dinghuensis]MCP3103714.1 lycopene cyclase domain-containing protein [Myxococcus dinghuensis]
MTYARFLGLFVLVPIVVQLWCYRRTFSVRTLAPMGLLLCVVYAATSPWDNLAVKWGLWGFDPERIWGIKLGWLPLEEYLFFGLQTLLVGLWARARLARVTGKAPEPKVDVPGTARDAGLTPGEVSP